MYPMLFVSLDCPFLVGHSGFSNVLKYFATLGRAPQINMRKLIVQLYARYLQLKNCADN